MITFLFMLYISPIESETPKMFGLISSFLFYLDMILVISFNDGISVKIIIAIN